MKATDTKNAKVIIPLITGNNDIRKCHYTYEKAIIGQPAVSRKLSFYTKSHSMETPFPTLLLSGSAGLGKTFTSGKIAEALGRELITVNCSGLDSDTFFNDVLFGAVHGENQKTLLLDESHKLPKETATHLLSCLNPNKSHVNIIGRGNVSVEFDMRKINVIFATTAAHQMLRPLVNRCKEIYFTLYSNEDLYKILNMYLDGYWIDTKSKRISVDPEDIGWACRGRARTAFLLAEDVKRWCIMNGKRSLDRNGWKELKSVFGIHQFGLNDKEVTLLKLLEGGTAISGRNIAIALGVSEENIEEEYEIRGKEIGLIASSSKGRVITEKGVEYLKGL